MMDTAELVLQVGVKLWKDYLFLLICIAYMRVQLSVCHIRAFVFDTILLQRSVKSRKHCTQSRSTVYDVMLLL